MIIVYEFINKHKYSVEVYDDDMLSLQFPYKSARSVQICMCHFPHFACKLPQKEHAKQQTPNNNKLNEQKYNFINNFLRSLVHMGKH